MKKITLCALVALFSLQLSAQHIGSKSDNSSDLGKNIISFSPLHIIIANANESTPDVAIGISYERILKNDLMSIKIPVSISIRDNYMYFMPTLKLYPTHQGTVRYSVGPQFLIGMGDGKYNQYTYNQNTGYTTQQQIVMKRKQLGFMVNNGINFTLLKSLFVGLDAGLGVLYYDNIPNDVYINSNYYTPYDNNSSISPTFQINFNMGYRF